MSRRRQRPVCLVDPVTGMVVLREIPDARRRAVVCWFERVIGSLLGGSTAGAAVVQSSGGVR